MIYRISIPRVIFCVLILCVCLPFFQACKTQQSIDNLASVKKNVLFIMVDDLRPELGVYGANYIVSPHIDKLAKNGVAFNRAYCNVPVCGASRSSLISGLRPTNNRFLTFDASMKDEVPNVLTVIDHFNNLGYTTVSNGKITHHKNDIQGKWNEEWTPISKDWRNYLTEENNQLIKNGKHGNAYEKADVQDDAYYDGQIAAKSIEDLKKLKSEGNPFFLAVGFLKPHLPFNAPKKYWDLYNENQIKLPDNYVFPTSAPEIANHNWGELRYYNGIPQDGPVTDEMAKKLIHAYYASVSFIDAQVGKVVQALDDLGLRESTSIILVGDHGWSLAEHGLWAKHSNFHVALQIPLIISDASLPKGKKTESIAEMVDLYPTICDLARVSTPKHVDGTSLKQAANNPKKIYKSQALARWQKGETLIANNYFYTEWIKDEKTIAKMLYDHNIDPNENRNLAVEEAFKPLVDSLRNMLHQQIANYKTSNN